MGQTQSDRNRSIYTSIRNSGKTHEEALNAFSKPYRAEVKKDLKMTAFKSHFGIKASTMLIIVVVMVVGILLIVGGVR